MKASPPFTDGERRSHIKTYLRHAEQSPWLTLDPSRGHEAPAPMRELASLMRGLVAIAESDGPDSGAARDLAAELGGVVLAISDASDFSGAPFPTWRRRGGRLGRLSDAALSALEACGELETAVRGGWVLLTERPEEHFFDTGLVGEAMVELHTVTEDERFLAWAEAAGDWLAEQPVSPNFNYNAFPAFLHLALFDDTGEAVHLQRAAGRLERGVLPGMIATGADAGHWVDPHNERLVYRAIMARTLAVAAREGKKLEPAARLATEAIAEQLARDGHSIPEEIVELCEALGSDRSPAAEAVCDRAHSFARTAIRDGKGTLSAATAYALLAD